MKLPRFFDCFPVLPDYDTAESIIFCDSVKLVETNDCIIKVPTGKKVVIKGLEGCNIAEYDNTLPICRLIEGQRLKGVA